MGYRELEEETPPLLSDPANVELKGLEPTSGGDIYDRFGRGTKWKILTMVSLGGLLPFTVGWSFVPSIPQIAKDLNSSPSFVSLGVSISIFSAALGSITGATYAGFYGRKKVYLYSLPVLFFGSVGVALSQTVSELMVWRFFQSMGSAPGASVGAGTIGDIYRSEERGRAMSVFFAACLIGPSLGPLMGGFAAHYASWRIMQFILGCIGLVLWALMFLYLPETSHPGSRHIDNVDQATLPRWRPVLLNPLAPLALLRSPALLSIAIVTTCSLLTYQVLLIPLVYTLGQRYGITNEAVIGACYLAAGTGNMVGTPIIGHISDMAVIKWKKRRNGVCYPEDRLRPALWPSITIVPLSCFFSGLLSAYGTGRVALALDLFCLFLSGFGLETVWGPCAAYLVDVMHAQSAQSIAANAATRSALVSLGICGILPMINAFGVVITNTVGALASVFAFGVLFSTVTYGKQLREFVDVGFTVEGSDTDGES